MRHSRIRRSVMPALIVVLVSVIALGTPARAQEPDQYLPDEVVVKLTSSTDLAGIAADYALDPMPLDRFGTRAIYRLRILDGATPPDRASALAADPRVIYAEPNYVGRAPEGQPQVSWAKGSDGGAYASQWAASMIRLPEAHSITRGAGVTVAVLDTGINRAHPVLAGRLVNGYDFVDLDADPSEVGANGQNVMYGHGTHVAGLIALVAPEARIMPVRVLDMEGASNSWVIAEALAYAMNPDGSHSTPDGADVINLSLSTDRPTNLLAEVVAAVKCDVASGQYGAPVECLNPYQYGAVVVAAAGNSSSNNPEYPAAEGLAGSLAVGASTMEDGLASFSNYGSWVHLVAPGVDLLSSLPGGGYGVWSGTSMATPLVAGEAALVRAAQPHLTAAAVVGHILSTSTDIGGAVPKRIDAAAALGLPIVGEYVCTGVLGVVAIDNLFVPQGHSCQLNGTRIKGNVKVESSASLNANRIYVKGSLQIKGAASVAVDDSTVVGNVQIEESRIARLASSIINGDVQFFKNTGDLSISDNTIGGNLQCKDNSRAPTGGSNHVGGNKEDQCAGL
jgi:subtilisin family serine protease